MLDMIISGSFNLTLLAQQRDGGTGIYYVDATSGDDNNNGISPGTAWQTIAKVNASTFNPGDQVLFKRGEIFNNTTEHGLEPPSAGTAGSPITLGAYGSGDKPIINSVAALSGWDTSGNWTDETGNVWSFSLTNNPWRVWLSGTEYKKAETVNDIDSISRWFYDVGGTTLSVYATSNPASFYSNVEAANAFGGDQSSIHINTNIDCITIRDLDVRGSQYAISVRSGQYPRILNCAVGLNSRIGVRIAGSTGNSVGGEIDGCAIVSGHNFSYDYITDAIQDGVICYKGTSGWNIHHNTIADWGHDCITLICDDAGNPTSNNLIYRNEMSAANTSYCRAFSFEGVAGGMTSNKFYLNNAHDLTVRSQLAGSNIEIYYNLFYDITANTWDDELSAALSIQNYSSNVAQGNKIYNNIFANIANNGLQIVSLGGSDISGCLVRNNIFYECGIDSAFAPNKSLFVENDATVTGNTFENNIFYNAAGLTNIIRYRDVTYNLADFESNVSNSDIAANNIADNPDMTDPDNGDFTLTSVSPCRDAGRDVCLNTDYADFSIPQETNPAIGAYEYVA